MGQYLDRYLKMRGVRVKDAGNVIDLGKHAMHNRLREPYMLRINELIELSLHYGENFFLPLYEYCKNQGVMEEPALMYEKPLERKQVVLSMIGDRVLKTTVKKEDGKEESLNVKPEDQLKQLAEQMESMQLQMKMIQKQIELSAED